MELERRLTVLQQRFNSDALRPKNVYPSLRFPIRERFSNSGFVVSSSGSPAMRSCPTKSNVYEPRGDNPEDVSNVFDDLFARNPDRVKNLAQNFLSKFPDDADKRKFLVHFLYPVLTIETQLSVLRKYVAKDREVECQNSWCSHDRTHVSFSTRESGVFLVWLGFWGSRIANTVISIFLMLLLI